MVLGTGLGCIDFCRALQAPSYPMIYDGGSGHGSVSGMSVRSRFALRARGETTAHFGAQLTRRRLVNSLQHSSGFDKLPDDQSWDVEQGFPRAADQRQG